MTISIWRYSHLILAFSASLFLVIASVTGCILAVEPIQHQLKDYAKEDLDEVSLATTLAALKKNYDEVFSLEVESSAFVKASVLTADLETLDVYINPVTAEQFGPVTERPAIYSFATNLHRSLFLKSLGRFFVGLISLLLFLIAITGFILLVKRQGGLRGLFSKVKKDYFEMRYHVILSRWFFIPIVILALTGVYLSLEKFELLPETQTVQHEVKASNPSEDFSQDHNVSFFEETYLNQIRAVEFPFSEAPDDYFIIALKDREVWVEQQNGQIINSVEYPLIQLASRLSFNLHTGTGSVLWSIILLLASASILFFIYSGFVMFFKRKRNVPIAAMPPKDDCEYIILVGSETGTTYDSARRLYNGLRGLSKKVFLTEMNAYTTFPSAQHLIILTSTYGDGEPPTNSRKFEARFRQVEQPNTINYSVCGFGSLEYPDFCKFALAVENILEEKSGFQKHLDLHKINNADHSALQNWVAALGDQLGLDIPFSEPTRTKSKSRQIPFEVIQRTELNVDDTFLLRLKPKKNIAFRSGDLLTITLDGTEIKRQYSIAKMGKEVLLSVKKHEFGRGSSFLFSLEKGEMLKAVIDVNSHFHFPKSSPSALLIANGTGIAPFLGMLQENRKTPIHLFWGGRTRKSSALYDDLLKEPMITNTGLNVIRTFSREEQNQYVQDALKEQCDLVIKTIRENGVIMICGSLAMQHDVLDILEGLLRDTPELNMKRLEQNSQLMMDCY